MNLASSAYALTQLAQGGEHTSQHSFNPMVVGAAALAILLILLLITTSFNRDR